MSPAVKYERIKFLVIALKSSVEVYAWAPKPYHKFMAFKVPGGGWRGRGRGGAPCPPQHLWGVISLKISPGGALQSFADLPHRPLLVELTVEEGQRLKVIYGSCAGFHAIDVDSGNNYDIYIPVHVSGGGRPCGGVCFAWGQRGVTVAPSGPPDPVPDHPTRHRLPAKHGRDGDAPVL